LVSFIIRDNPDLDHIFPIIYFFLKKNKSINILNFEINLDLNLDPKINFLKKRYPENIRIYEIYNISGKRFFFDRIINFLSYSKYKKVNLKNLKNIKKNNIFDYFIFFFIAYMKKIVFKSKSFYEPYLFGESWAENVFNKIQISSLVMDDSYYLNYTRPQALINIIKKKKIKITLVPHTCHMFKRDEDIENLRSKNLNNFYPNIAVTSKLMKKILSNCGINSKKIKILGSARFCKENLNLLKKIYKKKNSNFLVNNKIKFTSSKLRVLYIDGAYDNSNEKLNLLNNILKLNFIILTIKAHPRGNFGNNITSSLKERFKLESNLNLNIDASTMTQKLIEDNDIILGTYSSTLIDAILLNKKIVLPKFLVKNFNIFFEDRKFVFVCHNVNEVILLLKKLSKDNCIKVSNKVKNDKNDFLRKYVYGDCIDSSKILKSYYNLIK
jgi:hypothetical protein